jgi:hypothetical protein
MLDIVPSLVLFLGRILAGLPPRPISEVDYALEDGAAAASAGLDNREQKGNILSAARLDVALDAGTCWAHEGVSTVIPVPSYEQVIETYTIGLLKAPGDLQLTAGGDIAVHDGDLKFGNDQYNAMFRLVQAWRFNSPTLAALFNLAVDSGKTQNRLTKEQDELMSMLVATNWSRDSIKEYHAKNDEIGASEIGEGACAGALFIILSNLLLRFKNDLQVVQDRWVKSGPLISGISVGLLVSAAANNFRHYDEWRRSTPPTRQQRSSMSVISQVLGSGPQLIRENVCPKLLEAISHGIYENLNKALFEFAKSVSS